MSCAWTFPNLSPFPAGTETALPPVALIGGSPIVDAAAGQGVGRDTAALQHVELALGDKALLSKLFLDAPDHGGDLRSQPAALHVFEIALGSLHRVHRRPRIWSATASGSPR